MGPAAAGNGLVVLDGNVAVLPVEPDWLGGELLLRAFAGRLDGTGTALSASLTLGPVLPLPPVHLRAVRGAGATSRSAGCGAAGPMRGRGRQQRCRSNMRPRPIG